MAWTITESQQPRQRGQDSTTRVYEVDATGETIRNADIARTEVADYLDSQVEDTATGAERTLAGAETPGAGEVRLRYFLHGFPAQSLVVEEIEGTEGYRYRATAEWGTADAAQQPSRTNATSQTLNVLVDDPDVGGIKVSHNLTASVSSRSIDYAPVVAVLSRELGNLSGLGAAPLFPVGTLSCLQDEVDGPVKVRELNFNPPPADRTVTFELAGPTVASSWVEGMGRAAKRGTLNTSTFTMGGIAYEPLELLLVGFSAVATVNGNTTVTCEFAFANNQELVVSTATNSFDDDEYSAPVGVYVHGDPTFYFHTPHPPTTYTVTPDGGSAYQAFRVSGHDFVWTFKTNTLDDAGGKVVRVENVSIHRMFAEADFSAFFGQASL